MRGQVVVSLDSVDALSLPAGLRGSSSSISAFMPKLRNTNCFSHPFLWLELPVRTVFLIQRVGAKTCLEPSVKTPVWDFILLLMHEVYVANHHCCLVVKPATAGHGVSDGV